MNSFAGLVPWKRRCRHGCMLPPYPLPGGEGRFAAGELLLGAKPALTLAVPLVSPPTSPTSSAGHAPYCRFWIEELPANFAVFGGKAEALLPAREIVKKKREV